MKASHSQVRIIVRYGFASKNDVEIFGPRKVPIICVPVFFVTFNSSIYCPSDCFYDKVVAL